MTDTPYTVDSLFAAKAPVVQTIYERLLAELRAIGPFAEEPKKTSIHLVGKTGFAGVHPRKSYLYLNLRTQQPIESPRIRRSEQVSRNRYHNEVRLSSPNEVDTELIGWLREAYELQ